MSLEQVRSITEAFRRETDRRVLEGNGDPTLEAQVGTLYHDSTTKPATVWIRQRSGWMKLPFGARE